MRNGNNVRLKNQERPNPARETLKNDEKNSYGGEKIVPHENRPTGNSILFGGTATELKTTMSNPPLTFPIISGSPIGEDQKKSPNA